MDYYVMDLIHHKMWGRHPDRVRNMVPEQKRKVWSNYMDSSDISK